jgi:hypothetical protein
MIVRMSHPVPLLATSSRPARHCARLALLLAICVVAGPAAAADDPQAGLPGGEYAQRVLPLLTKYCSDCHAGAGAEAGIDVTKYDTAGSILADREAWGRIAVMLDFGGMPPDEQPQPTADERKLLGEWINGMLALDCTQVRDPGRVTIRRLNRAEYDNTIRDLVGLDLKLARDFPSDDVGEGFDNIADVLSLPPLLLEKYLSAAEQVAESAINASRPPGGKQRRTRGELAAEGGAALQAGGDHQLYSNGSVSAEFEFPRDGRYVLRVEAGAQQAGDELAKVQFRLDGEAVHVAEVRGTMDRMEMYELVRPVSQGKQRFSAAFINDYYNPSAANPADRDRNLAIRALEVEGPVDQRPEELSASHRRIVIATPDGGRSPQDAARQVLSRFATRAFRRPASDDEVQRLVRLFSQVMERGDSYERAIQVAVAATLVSPHFLYRIEDDPPAGGPPIRRLNDYELASRLSYFLWSSMPDQQLMELAERGELQRPEVLAEQVRRMLQDSKAEALVENFGGQWLNLRNLQELTPDPEQFPDFDAALRGDMQRETELLFLAVLREDRSILDFLTADFTHVNQRLARHYGIPGIQGEDFQRVPLPAGQRVGLLTQASILTLTSNPTRTSPVKRGKWILDNILGTPPPDPPPNVPALDEVRGAPADATVREQLVLHRENPVCASCHVQMDELGFALENFDPIGRWRDGDRGKPIDASGVLPGGEAFDGALELVEVLRGRQQAFAEAFSAKLLTYALGRGLEYYDQCAIESIVDQLDDKDFRFSALVLAIVTSSPFRERRVEGGKL